MKDGTFSAKEFAQILGMSKNTLFQYEKAGKLPPPKRKMRGNIPYRVYTIEDLVEAKKQLGLPLDLPNKRRQLFLNFKGGVGKTVVSANYAYKAALYGIKTLLIDLDSQGHCTRYMGIDPESCEKTLADVLTNKEPIQSVIRRTKLSTLDLVPANLELAPAELALTYRNAREFVLRKMLDRLEDTYSLVVMDAHPNMGLLNLNAILAANDLIIPVWADFLSYDGLRLLFEVVANVKEDFDYMLDNIYIFTNGFDKNQGICLRSREALEKHYADYLLKTIVRKNTTISDSTEMQKAIFEHAPSSRAAKDIEALVQEILQI